MGIFSQILDTMNESVALVDVPLEHSEYGTSYTSPFLPEGKYSRKFYGIIADGEKVGEVEYGNVLPEICEELGMPNAVEIISMVIEGTYKGKGFGKMAFDQFRKLHPRIILMATKQSKKFWMKMGFAPMKGKPGYFKYGE